MFTPEEIEQQIERALASYDKGNTERAALIAQIAQAEALALMAFKLGQLTTLIENVVDLNACCVVTRLAES